jgi:uncharacterized protein YjiS (DUF1127 family)
MEVSASTAFYDLRTSTQRTEHRSLGVAMRSVLVTALRPVQVWSDRWAYRSMLRRYLRLSHHLVRDLGLTFEDAKAESELPIWQSGIAP